MNLLLTPTQFSPKNIIIGEIKQNKMMNGIFTKMEYKDESLLFNSIYVAFNIENPVCEIKEKAYRNILLNNRVPVEHTAQMYNEIRFDVTPNNCQIVTQISQLETNIISQYNKHIRSIQSYPYILSQGQKKHISIKHNLYNQKFKLYNDFTPPVQYNVSSTFMLKISGIWEDETHIGLTYKITQVNPVNII